MFAFMRLVIFLAMIGFIVGCNQAPPQPDIAPVSLAPLQPITSTVTAMPPKTDLPTAPASSLGGSEPLLNLAKADLAAKQKVTAEQISVAAVSPVEWPDASLGCPTEGMMYAQILTPGYLITLTIQSQTFTYHTDQKSTVTFCQP